MLHQLVFKPTGFANETVTLLGEEVVVVVVAL